MSTETPVASVPADDQPIEDKVKEETHVVKEGDESPPAKDDEKKDEKEDLIAEKSSEGSEISTTKIEETPENNQTEVPIVVEDEKVDDVPVEASLKEVENAYEDPEASSTKDSPSEVVERQADESPTIEAVEDVPEEKPEVESVENAPVEKIATEAVEDEAEKTQTIKADENKPNEKPAIEQVDAVEKEEDENKPVEKAAIEEAEREAEKAETIEAVEKEAEKAETIEAAKKEAEKTQAIEEDETKPDEKPATEPVEKQIDDENPKVEAFEANLSTEAAGELVGPSETSLVKDSESVNEAEGKPHEQLKVLLEMERNIEKEVKPEENVATDTLTAEKDTLVADAEKPVAENTDKEAAGMVDETVVSENAAEKEEKIVNQETEEKKSEDENVAEVADRDLVEGKEVLVKEDEYKDIKVNEEVVVPSAIVEPVGEEAKAEETLKADDAKKLEEKTEETKNDESKADADQTVSEASKDEAKQEVSVKAAQKQSGGIISKVKQSIVKVKKAIIGKSPSSKVLSPEVKADEHVK